MRKRNEHPRKHLTDQQQLEIGLRMTKRIIIVETPEAIAADFNIAVRQAYKIQKKYKTSAFSETTTNGGTQ